MLDRAGEVAAVPGTTRGRADRSGEQRVLGIREVERPLIARALAATRGNQLKAADVLGLNRNTLRKKIRELGDNVAREVQRVVHRYKDLQDIIAILGMEELSEEDKQAVSRARPRAIAGTARVTSQPTLVATSATSPRD